MHSGEKRLFIYGVKTSQFVNFLYFYIRNNEDQAYQTKVN